VRVSAEIAGIWRAGGSEIDINTEDAKHLSPPYGRVLLPVDDISAGLAEANSATGND
jgi:hypothetical protein